MPGWAGMTLTDLWSGAGPGTLKMVNPSDLPLLPQIAPSNTGVDQWTFPDGIDGEQVKLEKFGASVGDLFVDTDQFTLQLDSIEESQIAASLLGLRFRNPIPPRTTVPVEVPISVTGGAGTAKIYMTPRWQRPW